MKRKLTYEIKVLKYYELKLHPKLILAKGLNNFPGFNISRRLQGQDTWIFGFGGALPPYSSK